MLARLLLIAVTLILSAGAAPTQVPESETDRALIHSDFTWRSIAEGGVRLHYQPDSFAERHRIMLLCSAQGALARALRIHG